MTEANRASSGQCSKVRNVFGKIPEWRLETPSRSDKEKGWIEGSRRSRREFRFVDRWGELPAVEWIDRHTGKLFDGEAGVWQRSSAIRHVFVPRRSGRRQASPGAVHSTNGWIDQRHGARRIRRAGPARPNRVHRATSWAYVSIRRLQYFGSRHRARSSRWNELGSDVNGGYARRAPSGASSLKWMRRLFHPKPRYGRDADPLTGVARVEIRCASTFHGRPYPGRVWACSPGEVSLTTRPILDWRPEWAAPLGQAHQRRAWMAFGLPQRENDQWPLRVVTDPSHATRRNGSLSHRSE